MVMVPGNVEERGCVGDDHDVENPPIQAERSLKPSELKRVDGQGCAEKVTADFRDGSRGS